MQGSFQKTLGLAIVLFAASVFSGCYEGWETPRDTVGRPGEPPGPPVAKPLSYLLFRPVVMGASAIANDTCFPKVGIRGFKSTEWSMRLAAIGAKLRELADTYIEASISIGATDCLLMSAVGLAAINAEPWGGNPPPLEDGTGRPIVELVAAFYEGEPPLSPQSIVTSMPWTPWKDLLNSGVNAVDLRYFVVSNSEDGYFTEWAAAIPSRQKLAGTPINDVDPTAAGQAAREVTVNSDAATLAEWVIERSL